MLAVVVSLVYIYIYIYILNSISTCFQFLIAKLLMIAHCFFYSFVFLVPTFVVELFSLDAVLWIMNVLCISVICLFTVAVIFSIHFIP